MASASEYLSFRRMITPIIIQVLFWIGIVVIVITGIVAMAGGGSETLRGPFGDVEVGGGGGSVFKGLLILIVGPIFWRVYCEILIVVFRMLDVLTEIRNAQRSAG